MQSPSEPIRFFVRLQRMTLVGGVALVACGAAWAFWPIRVTEVIAPVAPLVVENKLQPQHTSTIDPKVFAVNLWHTPPPSQPPDDAKAAAKPEPPKPLNVQLIGIINDDGIRRAALYDIEADRLLILGNGDHIRGSTIKSISETVVEITDGRTTRHLTLLQSPSLAPGVGGEHS